jgi:hypothetical protein
VNPHLAQQSLIFSVCIVANIISHQKKFNQPFFDFLLAFFDYIGDNRFLDVFSGEYPPPFPIIPAALARQFQGWSRRRFFGKQLETGQTNRVMRQKWRWLLLPALLVLSTAGCGTFVAHRMAQAPNTYPTWFVPQAPVDGVGTTPSRWTSTTPSARTS